MSSRFGADRWENERWNGPSAAPPLTTVPPDPYRAYDASTDPDPYHSLDVATGPDPYRALGL
jgi:hypothetical protein